MARSAMEFVKELGIGWNLGNTYDAFPLEGERLEALSRTGRWTPEDQQSLWFNVPFTQQQADNVRKAGFDTIRIPVTWMDWIDQETSQVDEGWMQSVRQAVDWSLDAGLHVILNVHHDGGNGSFSWIRHASVDEGHALAVYTRLWEQIAECFRDYDERLVFEGGNEICFPDLEPSGAAYPMLLAFNQRFVDTVRASGGCNARRYLLVPGYNTDTELTCAAAYQLPQDSAEDRLMVSIHYYSPAEFVLGEHDSSWCEHPCDTWGSMAQEEAVAAHFAMHRKRFIESGIPVVIGEYGFLTQEVDHKDHESNMAWLETVLECATSNGSCPIIWDTSTKEMRFLDRQTGQFFDPQVERILRRYMV